MILSLCIYVDRNLRHMRPSNITGEGDALPLPGDKGLVPVHVGLVQPRRLIGFHPATHKTKCISAER